MSSGSKQQREDESDLFSVNAYASGNSIPVIERVPLTPEELRRRRTMRILYAVIAITLIAAAVWAVRWWSHASAVDEAVMRAGDDGRVSSIRAALDLMADDEDPASTATKLRLRAMLVLAGADEETAPIDEALGALPSGDREVDRERGIAATYLALATGDLSTAMERASAVEATGDQAAEAARARAMAARAVGNAQQGLLAARLAMEARPESPRHVALYAELIARAEGTEAALERLSAIPSTNQTPESAIARARIMDRSGASLGEVAEVAQGVLDDERATEHERAWARLLVARASASTGDRVAARRLLSAAHEVAPPGDELFTLGLAEAALRIGAAHLAREVAERLPSPLSVDAGRRAQLSAELALAARDQAGAESALRHAPPDDPRTALARARLLEARSEIDEARTQYRAAAADPAYRIRARVHLAALELAQGNAREAATLVDPLLEEHDHHPDVVPIAVEAQLGLEHASEAMALVEPALAAHPEDVRLLSAKAHVQMALEQWEEALATLDTALGIVADDEDLHADRGRAAQHLARFEVAREAYDRALELSAAHPVALFGRLELDLADLRPAQARLILDRIDAAEIRGLRLERLRGQLLTMEIAGRSGLDEVRRALRAHPDDHIIRMSLAWLLMQAEQYATAAHTFNRALDRGEREGSRSLDAVLGRALAQIRMRAGAPARAVLDNVMEDLDEATLSAQERGELHAVLARLAWSDHDRVGATRAANRAIEADRNASEAHLVLAEIATDRDEDPRAELVAALTGYHPASRALAILAIREEEVNDSICEYARRYHAAAPSGQYARGISRVRRDCRADAD